MWQISLINTLRKFLLYVSDVQRNLSLGYWQKPKTEAEERQSDPKGKKYTGIYEELLENLSL